MSHSHLIPNVFIRRQLGAFLLDKEQATSLLHSHNIPASVLTVDGYSQSKKLANLAKTVWRLLDDESTGGGNRNLPCGFFKMLCHACSSCTNLKSVIIRTCKFLKIFSNEYQFNLEVKGEEAIFSLHHQANTLEGFDNRDYFIMSLTTVLMRWYAWLINETIKIERVEFKFSAFAPQDDFEAMYHSDVKFNQSSNRVIFSNHFLNKNIIATQEQLPAFLINAPHCFLSQYRQDKSMAEKVRKILKQHDEFAQLKLLDVAKSLYCSTATLTRKLKAEDTSFMEIKDRTRKLKALSLLSTTEMPITDIANVLGFSEASAFTRAFKKWTGDSPFEYKNYINNISKSTLCAQVSDIN